MQVITDPNDDIALPPDLEETGRKVLDAAFAVHRAFGPGATESIYGKAFMHALRGRGVDAAREVWLDVRFEGAVFERALRADLFVRGVIVELKAKELVSPSDVQQLVSYLTVARRPLGYVLNFRAPLMKHGIRRVINTAALNVDAQP